MTSSKAASASKPPVEPPLPLYCPRCFRPEDERSQCANFALGCPEFAQADPTKVVTVHCEACPKTRIIPVGNIMRRKFLNELGVCVSDQCQARVLLPAPASPLPPLKGD